jgi:tetratricopeptide (TPR) repeat protein
MNQALLNNDDMNAITVQAMMLMEEKEYQLALDLLDASIDAMVTDDFWYHLRASVHSALLNWDLAIEDLNKAIHLNADDASKHLQLGVYRTLQLFDEDPHRYQDHYPALQQIQGHYSDCLARDPANDTAWLNATETHLFLQQWDLAIATYGDSRAYITDDPHKVTHSWLGCLALVLCGDPVYDEDRQALYDQSIRFQPGFHNTRQVEILLHELADDGFDNNKLIQALVIHKEFLAHFDDET